MDVEQPMDVSTPATVTDNTSISPDKDEVQFTAFSISDIIKGVTDSGASRYFKLCIVTDKNGWEVLDFVVQSNDGTVYIQDRLAIEPNRIFIKTSDNIVAGVEVRYWAKQQQFAITHILPIRVFVAQ